MNRNFLKISVSIVALILALVFCLAGCKADDVAADLDTVKGEVAANKADAAKALKEATKALEEKITNNQVDIAKEVEALNAAISAANAAGASSDAALAQDIANAEAALNTAINAVKADLAAKYAEVKGEIEGNATATEASLSALSASIASVQEVLQAVDINNVNSLYAEINALTDELNSAKTALNTAINDLKVELEAKIALLAGKADVSALKEELNQINDALKVGPDSAIGKIAALNAKLDTYVQTTEDVIAAWKQIYKTNDLWEQVSAGYGSMTINGATASVAEVVADAFTEARIRLLRATNPDDVEAALNGYYAVIESVSSTELDKLNAAYVALKAAKAELDKTTTDYAAVRTNLNTANDNLNGFVEAKLIVNGEVVDLNALYTELVEDYNEGRIQLVKDAQSEISANIAALTNKTGFTTIKTKLADVDSAIAAIEADSVNVDELKTAQTNLRAAAIEKAVNTFIKAEIADAATTSELDDIQYELNDCMTAANTVGVQSAIDTVTSGNNALTDRRVTILAEAITANMNKYNGHLDTIYADTKAATSTMAAIRAEFNALKAQYDATHFSVAEKIEAVVELLAAEDAFQDAESHRTTLVTLISDSVAVANILDNSEFDDITGTKSEYLVIDQYNTARNAWVARLDALYANFEDNDANSTTYTTIRNMINEASFENEDKTGINDRFEAEIAELKAAATDVKNAIADYTSGNITFASIVDINAAVAAMNKWNGLATDAAGYGYILELVTNGEVTHATLETVINNYKAQYNAYVAQAKTAWAACYTSEVAALTAQNITVYENRLGAVIDWFGLYGALTPAQVAEYGLTDIGTTTEYEKINNLKTALESKIADAQSEGEELQTAIDNLVIADLTTEDKATVNGIRRAYNTWLANYGIIEGDSRNAGLGIDVDTSNLAAAESHIADLEAELQAIRDRIEALRVINATATSGKDAYFATLEEATAYANTVATLKSDMAAFTASNGNVDKFTTDEYTKIADCELYAIKYNAIVKLDEALAATKGTVEADAVDANGNSIYDRLDDYYDYYLAQVNTTTSASDVADPAAYIASLGTKAATDMAGIASEAV